MREIIRARAQLTGHPGPMPMQGRAQTDTMHQPVLVRCGCGVRVGPGGVEVWRGGVDPVGQVANSTKLRPILLPATPRGLTEAQSYHEVALQVKLVCCATSSQVWEQISAPKARARSSGKKRNLGNML